MVVASNKIDANKKYTSNAGNFDHHADAAVRWDAHHPMEHIPGFTFTRSHWMPPLGKCLRSIAPGAAMLNEFVAKHKITLTKHNF